MKYYIDIDVESTGFSLKKHAMIAFGAVIWNDKSTEIDTFLGCMKVPRDRGWEKDCLNNFWKKDGAESLKIIKAKEKNPREVMSKFVVWLDKWQMKYQKDLIILSDTAGYDYSWINTYLCEFTNRHTIEYRCKPNGVYRYHRILSTGSIYVGVLTSKTGENHESISELEDKMKIKNGKWNNDHNPLNDARNIVANYLIYLKNIN